MGRLRTEEDQTQRMRELEELEAELDLASSTVEKTVPKKRPRSGGLNFGMIALSALGILVLAQFVQFVQGIALMVAIVFGILWLVQMFRKKDED